MGRFSSLNCNPYLPSLFQIVPSSASVIKQGILPRLSSSEAYILDQLNKQKNILGGGLVGGSDLVCQKGSRTLGAYYEREFTKNASVCFDKM